MNTFREGWKQLSSVLILLLSLVVPTEFAAGFLVQGLWAILRGQLFGFPELGIAEATGTEAQWRGALLVGLGSLCALLAFLGIRYAARVIRGTPSKR